MAPLIGVHHDDLSSKFDPDRHSVAALIALSRHTDIHPADLVDDLAPLLKLRRLRLEPPDRSTDPAAAGEDDIAVVLSALTHARGPLSAAAIAAALTWTVDRVAAILDAITADPDIASPLALRHTPNNTYNLTPRMDLLTRAQRMALENVVDTDAFTFTADHTALILAAMTVPEDQYSNWKAVHYKQHAELIELGVFHQVFHDGVAAARPYVNPDVRYSLWPPTPPPRH